MTTYLNPWEIVICTYLTRSRFAENKKHSIGGYRNFTEESDEKVNILGIAAEMAFAKMYNIYFPLSQDPRLRLMEADFEIRGVTIDVKSTRRQNGRLLLTKKDRKTPYCDFYVLMIANEDSTQFRYAGHSPIHLLKKEENVMVFDQRPGKDRLPAYALTQAQLLKDHILPPP